MTVGSNLYAVTRYQRLSDIGHTRGHENRTISLASHGFGGQH